MLFFHVAISLVALAAGVFAAYEVVTGRRLDGWVAFFLATTVLTSVTGFLLPADRILPSHVFAVISLVALALAIVARYPRRLAGGWWRIYVVTAMLSFYLNLFVAIVQAFQKLPVLTVLAPTQSEPPFALAQGAAFVLFLGLCVAGVRARRAAAI